MLVDKARVLIRAGDGGKGSAVLRRDAMTAKGGPDGGDGGNGGSVYIKADHNITDLSEFRFKKKVKAEAGVAGRKSNLYGKNGEDLIIRVPLGTQVIEVATGESHEIEDEEAEILIAKGGRGGRGNMKMKTSTNRTPRYAENGTLGEEKIVMFNLRLIAEIGLVGLPNAGKSSLLTRLTNATPEIGAYPFTTLHASIGMLDDHAIADIPGLIEGAAQGKGLGTKFLKHIEKTKVLIHVIDASQPEPEKAHQTVRNEFKEFSEELLKKKEIILLNKSDLVEPEELKKRVKIFQKKGFTVLTSSVYVPETIDDLKKSLLELV